MGKGKVKHEPKGQVHGAPGTARATKTPRPVDPIEPTVRLGKSPPPLPPREALEARAAWQGTPDAVGAWWISLGVTAHLLGKAAERDAGTGVPLVGSLFSTLERVTAAVSQGTRPPPRDDLALAAELAQAPLEHLLQRFRTRTLREHHLVPISQVREVDRKSMAWLARLPGRTVREKLSGRKRVLAVVKRLTADCHENRVARRVLEELLERTEERLAYRTAFDNGGESAKHWAEFEEHQRLLRAGLRRSELAEIPEAVQPRPNNVLLSDPNYSRVWRAWQRLKRSDDQLPLRWEGLEQRLAEAAFWVLAGTLCQHPRALLLERLCRVSEEEGRLELLAPDGQGLDWGAAPMVSLVLPEDGLADHERLGTVKMVNLERNFGFIEADMGGDFHFAPNRLVPGYKMSEFQKGTRVRFVEGYKPLGMKNASAQQVCLAPGFWVLKLGLEGTKFISRLGSLPRCGVEDLDGQARSMKLRVDRDADLVSRRGVPLAVQQPQQAGTGAFQVKGDLEGLRCLSERMRARLFAGVKMAAGQGEPTSSTGEFSDERLLGVNLACGQVEMAGQDRVQVSTHSAHVVHHRGAQAEAGGHWLTAREGRVVDPLAGGDRVFDLGQVLDPESEQDSGTEAVALGYMFRALSRYVGLPRDARVAFTVPDIMDELDQRGLRTAMRGAFGQTSPVWRSAAAVLGWQEHDEYMAQGARPGDAVMVLDSGAPQLTWTLLGTDELDGLEARFPQTRGVHWARRPSLPPSSIDRDLSTRAQLLGYARPVLAQATPDLPASKRRLLLHWLERRGQLLEAVRTLAPIAFPAAGRWRSICFDAASLQHMKQRWFMELLKACRQRLDGPNLGPLVKILRKEGGCLHLLLVGEAFQGIPAGKLKGELYTLFSSTLGQTRVHCFPSRDGLLARGARAALQRQDAGFPAWRDWLPDLHLEVVKDGLYNELTLIREEWADAAVGASKQFQVEESLTLTAGPDSYIFPLVSGRASGRPQTTEISVTSRAFPLKQDTGVNLNLTYRYGLESSYELRLSPCDRDEAPFTELLAQWAPARQADVKQLVEVEQSIPLFPPQRPVEVDKLSSYLERFKTVLNDLELQFQKLDRSPGKQRQRQFSWIRDAVKRFRWITYRLGQTDPEEPIRNKLRLLWLDDAYPCMFASLGLLRDGRGLQDQANSEGKVAGDVLLMLANLNHSAPPQLHDLVWRRLSGINKGDSKHMRHVYMWMLGRLLRSPLDEELGQVLVGLLKMKSLQEVNTPLSEHLTGAVTEGVWSSEVFLEELEGIDPLVGKLLLSRCEARVVQLDAQVTDLVEGDASRKQLDSDAQRKLGYAAKSYLVNCELLLALLRRREDSLKGEMEAGSRRMTDLARLIRRLDTLLCRSGVSRRRSRILIDVDNKPITLEKTSDLTFALNAYLLGTEEMNLIHITQVEEEEEGA